MNYAELLSTYQKVCRVIRSSTTVAQLNTSRKYAELFVKQVPPNYTAYITQNINRVLRQKKRILWM